VVLPLGIKYSMFDVVCDWQRGSIQHVASQLSPVLS